MAAITLIAGSVLGWIAATISLVAGTLASTAILVFLVTSVTFSAVALFAAAMRQPDLT